MQASLHIQGKRIHTNSVEHMRQHIKLENCKVDFEKNMTRKEKIWWTGTISYHHPSKANKVNYRKGSQNASTDGSQPEREGT